MKFTLVIINTETEFRVQVFDGETFICGSSWNGRGFEYKGKNYQVLGPSQSIPGHSDKFWVAELVPVSLDY
jgi:hypothetical protein